MKLTSVVTACCNEEEDVDDLDTQIVEVMSGNAWM
jgi:hypothetical protein